MSKQCLELNPDNLIVGSASFISQWESNLKFVTNDICCKNIAKYIFGLQVNDIEDVKNKDDYSGFLEIILTNEKMAYLYEHLNENIYNLLINQYLIVKNINGEVVDKLKWTGTTYTSLTIKNINSSYFGTIKPYKGDIYQQCILDSFITNQVTMVKGNAGTGKSYLALGYLFYLLEKQNIDKIVIFTNTQPTANSAKLGFYPGTRTEKLLESNIGNMLSSKLGDCFMVEKMIQEGKILLLPMCDIRGYDTSGMHCGVYITEAQNMDISLMKLALQRIGEDCVCIIDGDYNTQVDLKQYAGFNNGMRRMSEVFRGQNFYGEVELQNIYRSKIAAIAELM